MVNYLYIHTYIYDIVASSIDTRCKRCNEQYGNICVGQVTEAEWGSKVPVAFHNVPLSCNKKLLNSPQGGCDVSNTGFIHEKANMQGPVVLFAGSPA